MTSTTPTTQTTRIDKDNDQLDEHHHVRNQDYICHHEHAPDHGEHYHSHVHDHNQGNQA